MATPFSPKQGRRKDSLLPTGEGPGMRGLRSWFAEQINRSGGSIESEEGHGSGQHCRKRNAGSDAHSKAGA